MTSPTSSSSSTITARIPPYTPSTASTPTLHPQSPTSSPSQQRQRSLPGPPLPASPPPQEPTSRRFPVTPALLRSIFSSSRTPYEERSISRVAFFRFTGFLLSCVAISFAATRGKGIKSGAGLLGVV
ncbi:hypothetical protein ID866_7346 [Astraeus odoratus]|nr:hypothetical protein ID866_7346 [Astraeus odoratus]